MVKQIQAERFIPDFTPQELFDCAFAPAEPVRRYHEECDGDPDCEVGEWEDGERTVVFCTCVNAPAAISRLLGMETLTIRETARREDEGEEVVLRSTPVLDFPGGSKFTTSSHMRLSPATGGCQMWVEVTCEAAGPWGLVGTIEDTMATQAAATVDGFLDFTLRWCAAASDEGRPAAAAAAGANGDRDATAAMAMAEGQQAVPPLGLAVGAGDGELEDEFYDTYPATPRSVDFAPGGVLQAVHSELAAVTLRVQKLEAAVQTLQSPASQTLPSSRPQRPSAGPSVGRRTQPQPPLHQQPQWPSLATVATGAAVVAAVAYVALQYGRRSGYAAARQGLVVQP